MNDYDYIVIGAGPAGLAFCTAITKNTNLNILLVDQESSIGGCHRVRRVDEIFTEHSVRVFSSAYKTSINLLESMQFPDFSYDSFFSSITSSYSDIKLDSSEMSKLFLSFLLFLINPEYLKNVSVKEYTKNFKPDSIEYLNNICITTDGTFSDRYSMNKLFEIINQLSFYDLSIPKEPNDKLLFLYWKKYLDTKIKILLNSKVSSVIHHFDKTSVVIDGILYNGKNIVFACPPRSFIAILNNSPMIQNCFGNLVELTKMSDKHSYVTYISLTIVLNKECSLINRQIYDYYDATEWNIILVPYVYLDQNPYLSVTVKNLNFKSSFINKTANECNLVELLDEVFRQLLFLNLDKKEMILSPGLSRYNNKWIDIDGAFVNTINPYKIPHKSIIYDNIFNIGTQNGYSSFGFTCFESAVQNGINLAQKLESSVTQKIIYPYTVRYVLFFILIILVFFIILYCK